MAITNDGALIEITGTEVGIAGLAGGTGVTVDGDVYTVGSPITEFRISGDLTIADYETLQIDDSVRFSRPNGGTLTMKPFSAIEILGLGRGADLINNTFRGGFTFNAEILELGGGRIQTPVFREAPNGRSDCFSCYSPDFDNGTGGGVTFNIQGLTLIYEPVTSAKLYATAASQLDNIHLKRFGGNFVELQVGFNNGAETKTFDKLIFDNVEQLSTRGGNTQVGSVFLLTTPRYLFPNDFTISFINVRSDVEFVEIRDIESIGTGQWDGTITNTFRGVRTTSTQRRTYLSGSTPVANIKTVYTPTGSIGSEISETSGVDGVSQQVLTYGEIQPSGVFFTGVIPQETWTVVAVGYNNRIPGSTFVLLDNASPQTSDEGLQVVTSPVNELDKSVVDAYTTIDNANELHDKATAFVVDNPVGLTDWLVTQVGDTINAGSFNVSIVQAGPAFAFDGSTITINSSLFNGNIATTGTVTGKEFVNGNVFDSTQDSTLREQSGATFTLYATEADRDARTNPIVSDTTNYAFLFSSVPANPVFLWVNSGATELPTTVTLVQGVNEFDLGTAGVLNTLSNLIQYIPSKIYIDVTASVNGTGTEVAPYNNVQSAIDNAPVLGTRTIVFMADTVIGQSLNDFKIEGTPKTSVVTLNNQVITNCTFSGLKITGAAGTGSKFNANKCTLVGVSNLNGTYTTSFIENTLIPASGGEVNMVDITSAEPADERPTLSFTGVAGVSLVLRDYRGGLNIVGMENSLDLVTVSGTECKYTVDASCTAGSLSLRGIGQLTDNSAGTTVDTTALNNPEQIGTAVSNIIANVDVPTSTRASQLSVDALNDLSGSEIANAVWDEPLTSATHNVPTSAGRRLRQLGASAVWDGTAQGSGVGDNQIQLDSGASSVSGSYDPSIISIIGGTGAGQSRMIYEYDGATRTATVDRNWRVNPDATSEFIIVSDAGRQHVNEGLAQGATATTITLNATASSIEDAYVGQTIFIRSGTGEDQTALILAYNGTTKVATIETAYNGGAWGAIPDTTSCYCILPVHVHPVSEIQEGLTKKADLTVVNDGVKKASLLIPHSDNLTP